MSQVTGRVTIVVSGKRLRSKEKAKLDMGGVERTAEMSDSGVDGYSEKTAVPRIEFKLNHTADLSLDDLRNFKDGTVMFETDTGKVFTITNAWCAKPISMTGGEVDVVIEGTECLEG